MKSLVVILACAAALSAEDTQKPDKDTKPAHGSTRVHLGGIVIGAGYSHFSGPYGPYSYWGPYLWDPYYYYWSPFYFHPGFYTGFAYGTNMGDVRLDSASKEGEVYLDGAYAGKLAKLKTMWLEPGKYLLEVKTPAGTYSKRIYVLTGKTLRLDVKPEGQS